jgi:hypothetical protein
MNLERIEKYIETLGRLPTADEYEDMVRMSRRSFFGLGIGLMLAPYVDLVKEEPTVSVYSVSGFAVSAFIRVAPTPSVDMGNGSWKLLEVNFESETFAKTLAGKMVKLDVCNTPIVSDWSYSTDL